MDMDIDVIHTCTSYDVCVYVYICYLHHMYICDNVIQDPHVSVYAPTHFFFWYRVPATSTAALFCTPLTATSTRATVIICFYTLDHVYNRNVCLCIYVYLYNCLCMCVST